MAILNEYDGGKVFGSTKKSFELGKKVVIQRGGTGSGKTFQIMMYLIFDVLMKKKNQVITIVSESYPHLEIGVIRYLQYFTHKMNIYTPETWNKSKALFTYEPTGSIIEFFSADRISKALGARRDWLYGNEINSLKVDVWEELARRSENIIADFNPTSQFWLEEWLLNYDDTVVIKSNYKDNNFLPETERKRIEKRASRDANFKRIHVDCEYGVYEGLVFDTWYQTDELPEKGRRTYGLDFGFTNDPAALVCTVETENAIFVDELFYQTGMLNSQIVKRLEALGIQKMYDEIVADSAEPKSIQEIHNAGFNIKPAVKGADSIRSGIDRLKSKTLYVTKRSTNLIKELRNYSWVVDKNGNATNKPIDDYNHAIDALRYSISQKYNFDFSIR